MSALWSKIDLRATHKKTYRRQEAPTSNSSISSHKSGHIPTSKWKLQAKETWDQSETQALLHTASSTATLLQGVLDSQLSPEAVSTVFSNRKWELYSARALAQNCSKSAGAKEECPCSRVRRRSRQLSMTSQQLGDVSPRGENMSKDVKRRLEMMNHSKDCEDFLFGSIWFHPAVPATMVTSGLRISPPTTHKIWWWYGDIDWLISWKMSGNAVGSKFKTLARNRPELPTASPKSPPHWLPPKHNSESPIVEDKATTLYKFKASVFLSNDTHVSC